MLRRGKHQANCPYEGIRSCLLAASKAQFACLFQFIVSCVSFQGFGETFLTSSESVHLANTSNQLSQFPIGFSQPMVKSFLKLYTAVKAAIISKETIKPFSNPLIFTASVAVHEIIASKWII
ncbi:uncharacterized protein LOC127748691 isoform X1 [Frankliniella occidentalis]|uniref:Uncharacterized protein LOC127748691 isoform X1 n=1 Tax=Frankliniella occidentalis TaxID=133901 RepID=A0A9C6WLM6_FRAOC|nr:uncharacterized protein LOC127748691 isoform X1 [Frankliniella occidentalis]